MHPDGDPKEPRPTAFLSWVFADDDRTRRATSVVLPLARMILTVWIAGFALLIILGWQVKDHMSDIAPVMIAWATLPAGIPVTYTVRKLVSKIKS